MNELKVYIKEVSSIIEAVNRRKETDTSVDDIFIRDFELALNELQNLESEQSTLKVKFRSKTAQVDEKIDELNKYVQPTQVSRMDFVFLKSPSYEDD